ncbi:MAG TPA: aminotransferase class I/II-fold pyridoxal phosphate-dependent enzyme, partial [Chitinophagaceae bacterium]|nr:aminotransferase class I/II-fold pyridoxal phosphate-dependent enzyme [Chitinophagaceae bacterium]
YEMIEEAESIVAAFHQSESALIYNSGYDANVGLLSCIPQRGDTIVYDQLSHASIRDGIRISFAESFSFNHNDPESLEQRLKQSSGNIFVVTESVFSMDGDLAPLLDLCALCSKYSANLIVDEAHATGVIGERGEGLVQQLQLQDQVFARIHTFGKALGTHGAAVLGSKTLKEYLINFSRPFIYSTALPETTTDHIIQSYKLFPRMIEERKKLNNLISIFQSSQIKFGKLKSNTSIQGVIVPGNEEARTLAKTLQDNDLDVRAILYPTVPKGAERLRIVLHSFNSEEELIKLLSILQI